MGQRPNDLTPHENLHHYWGAELRTLRVARGLSLVELGHQLHCDPSYLAKIERAERPIPAKLAESCDQVLEAHGALARLHALAEAAENQTTRTSGHASTHVATDNAHVASQAGSLTGRSTFPAAPDTGGEIIIPARTSDGRVVFVSVPRRVVLQGLGSATVGLATTPGAIPFTTDRIAPLPAVYDVNPIEHFQQMQQVLIENDRLFGPWRVIPVVREQISIMQQLRSRWRGADQRELVRVQAQYTDLCGWLYQDAGEHHLAESCIDRALALSHLAEDQDLAAHFLVGRADLACDTRMSVDAIGAGEQALRMASPRSRLAAVAPTYAGHGYALRGDHTAMERAYDRARQLLDTSDADPDSPPGPWFDENWITLRRARSLAVLGDYHSAAQSFQDAIVDLPSRYRRGRGVWIARTASALAGDRQVEQAATLGLETLAIGIETGSARILTELAQLNDQLAPWNTVPAVADFRIAMKDTILHQA
ncbi:MAG: helix-turn-helix domain-containing protein [Pseudonocardiaceae bacterium]